MQRPNRRSFSENIHESLMNSIVKTTDQEPRMTISVNWNSVEEMSIPEALGKTFINFDGISWWAAAVIMANCTIGMGLINFPYAYSQAGSVTNALVIQVITQALIMCSVTMLGYCVLYYGDVSYQGVMTTFCGRYLGGISGFCLFLNNFGACIVYLVVAGDQLERLMLIIYGHGFCRFWYLRRIFLVPLVSVLIIFPLSIMKRFDIFKYTSFLGILAAVYITFGVALTRYITGVDGLVDTSTLEDKPTEILKMIPLICFAYECHIELPPVIACLKQRSLPYFIRTVFTYTFLTTSLYVCCAISGRLTFGSSVNPDFLLSYNERDPLVMVAMAMLALKVVATYPVTFYCFRSVLEDISFRNDRFRAAVPSATLRRVLISVIPFVFTVIFSILIPSISEAINIIGGLSSAFVFIFPGLCFMQAHVDQPGRLNFLKTLVGVAFVILGTFLSGCITVMAIDQYINSPIEVENTMCKL